MADPYTTEFYYDPVTIKQEPPSFLLNESSSMSTSASVPIPGRRHLEELHNLENIRSPMTPQQDDSVGSAVSEVYQTLSAGNTMWGTSRLLLTDNDVSTCQTFKMDEDDIFQVDKADLIQGPTLAELNANDDTFLQDLNFDDLILPEENSYCINIQSGNQLQPIKFTSPAVHITNLSNNNSPSPQHATPSSCPQSGLGFYRDPNYSVPSSPFDPFSPKSSVATYSPASHNSSTSSLVQVSTSSPPPTTVANIQVVRPASLLQQKHSTLHELLMKRDAASNLLGRSTPVPSTSAGATTGRVSRSHGYLSSSAPTHLNIEQIWQRREPRQHLLSTGSLVEAGSTSSLSTGSILSPEAQDFSHDEGFDSDEDSDIYEDFSSDDSDDDNSKKANKKERFFWQYNVQSKGPKGQRLVLKTKLEDPHVLNEVTDPVFSPNCAVRGIKHSGKARKGDGNDLTPNPRKLYSIGKELDKLGRVINDMTPVSELPFNARPKTRKEKNKLASRACRLKKKAQHEANKLKLYGLETEHKRLINGIAQVKDILKVKVTEQNPDLQEEYTKRVEKTSKYATKIKIAGHSTEYVNKVLERVKNGVPGGGIDDF